jgi:hypothetical protein
MTYDYINMRGLSRMIPPKIVVEGHNETELKDPEIGICG